MDPSPNRRPPTPGRGAAERRTATLRRRPAHPLDNTFAYVSLCCGLACFVPWVVILTLPLALVFGVLGLLRASRLPERTGRSAALLGIATALGAAAFQLLLAGLAASIGWLLE